MGIRNITRFIKKHAPLAIQKLSSCELSSKTLAVDASNFAYIVLYRSQYNELSFIDNLSIVIKWYTDLNITLIFVFDGPSPILKQIEKDKCKIRKNIKLNSQHYSQLREFFETNNIKIVNSCSEAEATCVKLVNEKIADYVLTKDSDTLAFGCSYIFKKDNHFIHVDLDYILDELRITHDEFIMICLLLKGDYTSNIKRLGYHSVFNIVKMYKTLENFYNKQSKYYFSLENYKQMIEAKRLYATLGAYSM